jgi:Cu+-exporting ATPase
MAIADYPPWGGCRKHRRESMMSERDLTLPVRGMNCGNCVGHVERALGGVKGVANARVSLATRKADVQFDPELVSVGDLVKAVQRTGRYSIPTETVILPIDRMTCGNCASKVERALNGVTGTTSARVSLATRRATVAFVPGVTGQDDFTQAVAEIGYRVL